MDLEVEEPWCGVFGFEKTEKTIYVLLHCGIERKKGDEEKTLKTIITPVRYPTQRKYQSRKLRVNDRVIKI